MATKIFSLLTLATIDPIVKIETDSIVLPALNSGWYMRTNALLGDGYVGCTHSGNTKLLYVPVGHVVSEVTPTVPEPSEDIIKWANELLLQAKLKPTPVNRSMVYSLFGYNSQHSSRFIISTSKHLTNKVLKKLVGKRDVPIINTDVKGYQLKVKELL